MYFATGMRIKDHDITGIRGEVVPAVSSVAPGAACRTRRMLRVACCVLRWFWCYDVAPSPPKKKHTRKTIRFCSGRHCRPGGAIRRTRWLCVSLAPGILRRRGNAHTDLTCTPDRQVSGRHGPCSMFLCVCTAHNWYGFKLCARVCGGCAVQCKPAPNATPKGGVVRTPHRQKPNPGQVSRGPTAERKLQVHGR